MESKANERERKLVETLKEYSDYFKKANPPETPFSLNSFIVIHKPQRFINRLFVDILNTNRSRIFRKSKMETLKKVRNIYEAHNKGSNTSV